MKTFSIFLLIFGANITAEASSDMEPASFYGVLPEDIRELMNNTMTTFGNLFNFCSTETKNISLVGGTDPPPLGDRRGIIALQNLIDLQLEATEAENRYLKEKLQKLEKEYNIVKDQVLQWHQGVRDLNPLLHASDSSPLDLKQWPKDCQDLFIQGHNVSGVYTIYPQRCGLVSAKGVRVWCDMDAEYQQGWSVIISRRIVEEQVDFNQGWKQYRLGFGDPATEHWIGNDVLHAMTNGVLQTLRVDLEDVSGTKKYAEYSNFRVDSVDQEYQLHVSGYSGTAGDSFTYQNGMFFTTGDRDNDEHANNCADLRNGGGFWFKSCSYVCPTGQLAPNLNQGKAATWYHFHNKEVGLKTMIFKLRPALCQI